MTVPGSQRKVTSETTVRPPSCLVSAWVSIMAADSRPAAIATTVRGLRSPRPAAVPPATLVGGRGRGAGLAFVSSDGTPGDSTLTMACPAGCAPRCPASSIDAPDEERGRRDRIVDAAMYLVAFAISAATLVGHVGAAPALAARRGHRGRARDGRLAALAAHPSGGRRDRHRGRLARDPHGLRREPRRHLQRGDPGSRPRPGHRRRPRDRLGLHEPAALPRPQQLLGSTSGPACC